MLEESFADDARRMIETAHAESCRRGSPHVRTEALLLAITRDPDSAGARLLSAMGVNLERASEWAEVKVPRGRPLETERPVSYTPRAKEALSLAHKAARDLGRRRTGTDHVLVGIAREGNSLAAQFLRERDITPAALERFLRPAEPSEPVSAIPPVLPEPLPE